MVQDALDPPVAPEFSRPVPLDSLADAGARFDIAASVAECAELAKRFGLIALDSLTAELRLAPESGGRLIRLSGRIVGDAVQRCVVSLDPVPERVEETIEILYLRGGAGARAGAKAGDVTIEAPDEAEPLIGPSIDLGEIAAAEFALALNPYPRAPGAQIEPSVSGEAGGAGRPNPFEKLAKLKGNS